MEILESWYISFADKAIEVSRSILELMSEANPVFSCSNCSCTIADFKTSTVCTVELQDKRRLVLAAIFNWALIAAFK